MKVIIVTKPTNYEMHGETLKAQTRRGHLPEKDLEELREAHDEHHRSADLLRSILKDYGISYMEIFRESRWPDVNSSDVIFTIGGDGTVLSASHHCFEGKAKVIGIRSSRASVGYLCAGGELHIPALVEGWLSNSLEFINCERVYAEVYHAESHRERHSIPVLNDFLLAHANPAATTRYQIKVGERVETHKSSGIWVATATGSTAAIGAAGGEPMERSDRRFQYRVRELYKTPTEQFALEQGLFDPDETPLVVENRTDKSILALDGQRDVITLGFGDRVTFLRATPIMVAAPII